MSIGATELKSKVFSRLGRFSRSILTSFQSAHERNAKGVALMMQRNFQGAVTELTEALRLDPNVAAIYQNRAVAHYQLGWFEEALGDLDAALALCSELPDALCLRASIRLQNGDPQAALVDVNEAVRLAPERVDFRVARGAVWLALNDCNRAIDDLTTAIRSAPDNASALGSRGLARLLKGEPLRAIDDLNQAIRLNPVDASAYNNRGSAFAQHGEFRKAHDDFHRAVHLNPDHPHACRNLGWLLATCEDSDLRNGLKAVEYAQRAWQLTEGKYPEWTEVLAAAYAEANVFVQAIRWQAKRVETASERDRDEARARLELYRTKKPFRARSA